MKWVIFLVLLTGCSWSVKDRNLMVAYTALNIVDMSQTNRIFHDDDYYEINPVLSKDNFIPVMIGSNLLLWYLADRFPKFRTWMLGIGLGVKGGLVVHNARIGL